MTITPIGRPEIDLGLDRVFSILSVLGNPQTQLEVDRRIPIIHVTGTNGKGSTVEMIANGLLVNRRNKIGIFTSPFLVTEMDSLRMFSWDLVCPRVTMIPQHEWESIRETITQSLPNTLRESMTEFEFLFVTALMWFSSVLDLTHIVIEVGMGGRLDATNVFTRTTACVVTSIALDHEKFLGSTVESICMEKSKIFRHNSLVVISGAIQDNCIRICENEFIRVGGRKLIIMDPNDTCDLIPPMNGKHQKQLMGIAIEIVANILFSSHQTYSRGEIISVMNFARLPGRLERRLDDPIVPFPIILDGAHNGESTIALREFVEIEKRISNKERVFWILATSNGREQIVTENLLRSEDECMCINFFPHKEKDRESWIQCTPASELGQSASRYCPQTISMADGDIRDAIGYLTSTKSADWSAKTLIVVAGSLYLVRNYLQYVLEV